MLINCINLFNSLIKNIKRIILKHKLQITVLKFVDLNIPRHYYFTDYKCNEILIIMIG